MISLRQLGRIGTDRPRADAAGKEAPIMDQGTTIIIVPPGLWAWLLGL